jgi:hypothetical protein
MSRAEEKHHWRVVGVMTRRYGWEKIAETETYGVSANHVHGFGRFKGHRHFW